jgi:hypothetical protein
MNFQLEFLRVVTPTTGAPTLGNDADPRTVYGTAGVAPPAYKALTSGQDNILIMRPYSRISQPYPRVAVAYTGPTSAGSLTATLYVWDVLTQHWYLLGATKSDITLVYNAVTLVTVPSLGEPPPQATSNQGQSQSAAQQPFARNPGVSLQADSGGMAVMLCVDASGSPPAGTYQFAMSPSFSANIT